MLKIKAHYENMPQPKKSYPDDVGFDLTAMKVKKQRNLVFLLDTGISIEPPQGYYAEIHCRSSIYKTDFIMANNVGIIDPGYRGKLYMPLRYIGEGNADKEAEGLIGKRIGQLILRKQHSLEIQMIQAHETSSRGEKGLGSSGVD